MSDRYERTKLILGADAVDALFKKRVAVFGAGGVGGSCIEALARSGIGTIDVFDSDTVDITNFNRQALALESTLGMKKTLAAEKRIHGINPLITVNTHDVFYLPDTDEAKSVDFHVYDFVIDAIDTVTAKIDIIIRAREAGTPIVSCMGCGRRIDPTKLTVCDIYETKNDPLAKIMRHELKKRGVEKLSVVCSTEPAMATVKENIDSDNDTFKDKNENIPISRPLPGSAAFVPPAAGIMAASVAVRELIFV